MTIGFWHTKKNKFNVSHPSGLDAAQIEFLQSLKIGDRLKLWENDNVEGNASHYTLGKLENGVQR